MKRFLLKNMGCKSNQLEGSLIEQNLTENNFQKVDDIGIADFFILNSCTVTHTSDNEAIRILHHAKNQNPKIKTILTGCLAQIEKEKLLSNANIDIILGNDEKFNISEYLEKPSEKTCFADTIDTLSTFHNIYLEDTSKTRASLKIQDGCDNRCSYCIIPFARGKNRSADLDFILEQIKKYEDIGFKEIVLTGIHIGQWGLESKIPSKNLLYLLKNIEEKTNIPRYRLGSLNPLEINDEMLNFLKSSDKFCPHFHLSIQSMCDTTLKSMNRHYSVNQTLDLIEKISESFDLPFIGSDIIAGFAGESEDDFNTTVENLSKSKLTKIHTFPYSIRKGTIAEKMPNHLSDTIKNARATTIKEISAKKYQSFLESNLGKTVEILVEKHPDKKTGCIKGVSRNYIKIIVPDTKFKNNLAKTLQKVKIKSIQENVQGKIL